MNWISVAERLPEVDRQLVVVHVPDAILADVWPARWDANYKNFVAGGGWFEQDEITHWMPLPEPPK